MKVSAKAIRLSERDLYRILALRFASTSVIKSAKAPKEVTERLKCWLPYAKLSPSQLRRMVLKALDDPRTIKFLEVEFHPPVDEPLGEELKVALSGVREVLVIPSVADLDAASNERYLGLTAFQHFAPQISKGVNIAVSGGLSVQAFLQQLKLTDLTNLQLFALNCQSGSQLTETTGDILLSDLLARHWRALVAPNAPKPQVNVDPSYLSPERLDFALVSVQVPEERLLRQGVLAEFLGYRLMFNGSLLSSEPICPKVQAVSLSLLQRMVRMGKWVIVFATNADALLAVYRAHRSGGLLFNALVTDDQCSVELMRKFKPSFRLADIPQRQRWWSVSQKFRVAHLRYGHSSGHLSNEAIAERLNLSRKHVPKLLDEALQSFAEITPLVRLKVKSPSVEQELELALLETWNLREVRIATTFDDDEQGYAALGKAAAEFFCQLAEGNESFCVGISWGRSVLSMVDSLMLPEFTERLKCLRHLTFVALMSIPPSHSPLLLGTAPQSLLGTLMLRLSTLPNARRLPFTVSCLTFQNDKPVPVLDAVFTGIGVFAAGRLIEAYARELGLQVERTKWFGEMLFQFFDRKGNLLPDRWNGRVQAIPLSSLQRMVAEGKPVVVIAKGEQKSQALQIAHHAKLFNCLIADRSLAEKFLHGRVK